MMAHMSYHMFKMTSSKLDVIHTDEAFLLGRRKSMYDNYIWICTKNSFLCLFMLKTILKHTKQSVRSCQVNAIFVLMGITSPSLIYVKKYRLQ